MFMGNNSIASLKDLIECLGDDVSYKSYGGVLTNIRFDYSEIEHLCFWDQDNYSKITLEKTNRYELALICWEKGQQSSVHNHNNDEAWTYVVKGELTEVLFEDGIEVDSKVLKKRKISTLIHHPHRMHQLTNSFNGRTVSLHVYKQ